jgi:hypothetical protein
MKKPKGGSRLTRLIFAVIFAVLVSSAAAPLGAQTFSEVDTVSNLYSAGFPGDTISVSFDLVNTFSVGGFDIRITFDAGSFSPIAMHLTARSDSFEIFGSDFSMQGVARFFATSWTPFENAIDPGAGPVATLDMVISPNAVPGLYDLRFENSDSSMYENSLSDTFGFMIIPVYRERQIGILPLSSTESDLQLPGLADLSQNYPNPFNGSTRISFRLERPDVVELTITDLLGRVVAIPYSGYAPAGETSVVWDAIGVDIDDFSSGIYFYSLKKSGGDVVTNKMTLLK